MQGLAVVRKAPERDRDIEMHLAAASIATRPVLAMHKGPSTARKSYKAPPAVGAPCLMSGRVKVNSSTDADSQLDDPVWGEGAQPPSQVEVQRPDVRDGSYQVHQHDGLRLLKSKHMAGTGIASIKAGSGRRHNSKRPEAIGQTDMNNKQPPLPQPSMADDLGLHLEESATSGHQVTTLEAKKASSEDTDEGMILAHPPSPPVDVHVVGDEQDAVVHVAVSETPTSSAAAANAIRTVDEKESFSPRNQSLVTSNQEISAATCYRQAPADREDASTASINDIADARDAQQVDQHSVADYSPAGLGDAQASKNTTEKETVAPASALAAAPEDDKSGPMTTLVPEDDLDDKQQQYMSPLVPPGDVASPPHPHIGYSTRPTTTTSSLLAALSVAISGEAWQLPSVISSSESTIGTTPDPSSPLPHHRLNITHQQCPTVLPGGSDISKNTPHHKNNRPADPPLSAKRHPRPSSVHTWLSSKHNKTDSGLPATAVPAAAMKLDIKTKPHPYSFH